MAQQTVDWFRLIWDMVQRGVKVLHLAERTGIPEAALRRYISGSHPPHWRGELLIREWMKETGKPREEIQLETVALTVRVVEGPKKRSEGTPIELVWKGVKHG